MPRVTNSGICASTHRGGPEHAEGGENWVSSCEIRATVPSTLAVLSRGGPLWVHL